MDDQTVIVTGAAAGIGRAIATRCAADGAAVVVTDVDDDGCAETVAQIEAAGGDATAHAFDVTDAAAFEDVVRAAVDRYGSLDVLYNNAGIVHKADFEETTPADLEKLWAVNVEGVWNGCQAAVPVMRDQGGGSIVNTASIGGVRGASGLSGYCLTKGGVVNLTRALAVELGPDDIRVNAVCPGSVDHEMKETEAVADDVKTTKTALNRMGSPGEIADAAAYLGSADASFVTGQALVVDGGRTVQE